MKSLNENQIMEVLNKERELTKTIYEKVHENDKYTKEEFDVSMSTIRSVQNAMLLELRRND